MLDAGIRRMLEVLQAAGVETYESCEGDPGHAFLSLLSAFTAIAARGSVG